MALRVMIERVMIERVMIERVMIELAPSASGDRRVAPTSPTRESVISPREASCERSVPSAASGQQNHRCETKDERSKTWPGGTTP